MTIKQIYDWLNAIAPFDTAEGFDNVGLLIGSYDTEVSDVLFGMDVTEALVSEAVQIGAQLIISHHPFIFNPIKRIDYDTPNGRILHSVMTNQISIIAAHTNWDKASGGICDSLAKKLSLHDIVNGDDFLRIGSLPVPASPAALGKCIEDSLHIVPRCYGDTQAPITKVAVAGGAYGEAANLACELGAQAFVVGEIRHHEILDACARGLVIYDAGHYATEFPGVAALHKRFIAENASSHPSVKAHLHLQAPFTGAVLAFA